MQLDKYERGKSSLPTKHIFTNRVNCDTNYKEQNFISIFFSFVVVVGGIYCYVTRTLTVGIQEHVKMELRRGCAGPAPLFRVLTVLALKCMSLLARISKPAL